MCKKGGTLPLRWVLPFKNNYITLAGRDRQTGPITMIGIGNEGKVVWGRFYKVSRKFCNITFFTVYVPVAKANIAPSNFHMLRVEDIGAHPNESQLLPRGMTDLVWDVRCRTVCQSQK